MVFPGASFFSFLPLTVLAFASDVAIDLPSSIGFETVVAVPWRQNPMITSSPRSIVLYHAARLSTIVSKLFDTPRFSS